jgi:hypothetical protein
MTMRAFVGVDTNVLAFLAQAASGMYDPAVDGDAILKAERVAAFRVFLYSPCIAVTPTVNEEVERTADPRERAELEGWKETLLVELLDVHPGAVEARALLLRQYHAGERDCRIVAEAELGGLGVLLTFDKNLRKHLDGRAVPLRLRYPSQYWAELQIPRGQAPYWSPAPANLLRTATWWRWE